MEKVPEHLSGLLLRLDLRFMIEDVSRFQEWCLPGINIHGITQNDKPIGEPFSEQGTQQIFFLVFRLE